MSNYYDESYPAFIFADLGDLALTVPATIDVVLNTPKEYATRLQNSGPSNLGKVKSTVRMGSAQRAMVPGDVEYETQDAGGWLTIPFASDGAGGLIASGYYPIGPNLDGASTVRITIKGAGLTRVEAASIITQSNKVLVSATYAYVVGTGASSDPQLTGITPTSLVAGSGVTTLECTGTNFTGASEIEVDGVSIPTTMLDSTSLVCGYDPTAEGMHPVVVRTSTHVTTSRVLTVTAATLEQPPEETTEES